MGKRLGDLLVEKGLITEEQVAKALEEQKKNGGRIGANLVRMGFITDKKITEVLSEQFEVPPVDLDSYEVDKSVIKLIPPQVAEKLLVFPLKRDGKVLHLAMANPQDFYTLEDIKFATGFEIKSYVASENAILKSIERYYGVSGAVAEVLKEMEEGEEEVEVLEEESEEVITDTEAAPVVKLVNSIITEAVKRGASDIHIEPYKKVLRVRFRVDGVLHEAMSPQYIFGPAIVSRIKLMAKLDIAKKRLPQDGHINMKVGADEVDLRVSTLPTTHGEKVVMRIAKKTGLSYDLATLGFDELSLKRFQEALDKPNGIILVTGPTGSGKTVTLYSALHKLNTPNVNIMTAEDPVEYDLMGINQVNIREEIGLTFAEALRSFLRQDPDIVMVGEIRDKETAEIAIRAALTGHLVLSKLHTNDTAATIARLEDMGIPPYMIASSLILILAQRLVRRICKKCKEEYTPHPDELKIFGLNPEEEENKVFYRGKGCLQCGNTGYKGRVGIFEVLPITPTIRRMIVEGETVDKIRDKGIEEGMKLLRHDGIEKAKAGITTLQEILENTV